ncbi:MAG: iron-containing redox enzyme family protein [Cyanobacteria bacterium J06639_18]
MIPDFNNQQSAVNIESGCFASERVVKKTAKRAWKNQLVKKQKSAVDQESTGFIDDKVAMKTTKGTGAVSSQKSANDTGSASFVADQVAVKATKRTWAYKSSSSGIADPDQRKSVNADSVAKTRKLLDGAIALAWHHVKSNRRPPALTPTRWVWRLAGSYHLTHLTPQLMEKAAQRFTSEGRKVLAQWAVEKAREEAGHDRLALLDIQSMGYEAEDVVEALVPPAAEALVNYFIGSVWKRDPINCVGYSYTMERLALGVEENYIRRVEGLLSPGINATRCLRVHSNVGADAEHVEETIEMVTELLPQERKEVATACYETALLCFSPPKKDYISDEELHNVLRPLKRKNIKNYA